MNLELNDTVNTILREYGEAMQSVILRGGGDYEYATDEIRESAFNALTELLPDQDIDEIRDAMDNAVAGIHYTRIWLSN